jgi:sulfur-oxidizing protein SoxA
MPVYRMRWQTLGSLERRVRACYSGVQAEVPAAHDPLLRDLELFLKVRANGMALEGPSIRR